MAKIKNRSSRKKAQAKIDNKKQQENRWYDGYMFIPFDQSLDEHQIRNKCEFFGEMDDSKVINEVFNLPHIYKTTAHVFDRGTGKAVATVNSTEISERKTVPEMAQLAFDEAREGETKLNLKSSYAILRARKLTERDKLAIKAERLLERKSSAFAVLNYSAMIKGLSQ
ncbi:hypothetical protein [Psychrobacter vallis]|uniref:hypothetical protein n=1 Tax=Psychrobacter vallis TaxID=248451 RepID=UPI001917F0A6|nr:hypothetical protein [Psychrobacter vallis]